MKRIASIVAVMLMLTAGVQAQDSKGIYNKYSDNDEVSAVYISQSMFKLIGRIPDLDMGDESLNLGPLIKNLNYMYILDCEDEDICAQIRSDVNKYIEKGKFDMLMEIKDKGEVVRIYTSGGEKTVKVFMLTASQDDAITVICLDGDMNRADLERAIANASKNMN